MMIPTLCLTLRRRRGEVFLCDSNTRAFCAEGAKKDFYVIATQEPFAPKARRDFFFQKLDPGTAKNSLCKVVNWHFSLLNIRFFGFGQNFRKIAARI